MRLAGFVFVAIVLLYLSLRVSKLEARVETLVQALALQAAAGTTPSETGTNEERASVKLPPVSDPAS
jgi:hypothetical protein